MAPLPSHPPLRAPSVHGPYYKNNALTPSTTSNSPHTYWLALLARKTTGPAKSFGSPHLPAGIRSEIWRRRTGSVRSCSFLVYEVSWIGSKGTRHVKLEGQKCQKWGEWAPADGKGRDIAELKLFYVRDSGFCRMGGWSLTYLL